MGNDLADNSLPTPSYRRAVRSLDGFRGGVSGSDRETDRSERFLASEIIREKLFRLTGDELPYTSTVVIDAFVIVIIGGMGSFLGSIIGSVLVGFVQVLGAYYFQDLALAFMYLLMLLVLVVRPGGLLGKED